MSIFAIDFDGTITDGKFPFIGTMRPDADRVIKRLVCEGHTVIIWTCRPINNAGEPEMIEWLKSHEIPYHAINKNPDSLKFSTSDKIYADIYIDDRNLAALDTGIQWNEIEQKLEKHGHLKKRDRYKGKGGTQDRAPGAFMQLLKKVI